MIFFPCLFSYFVFFFFLEKLLLGELFFGREKGWVRDEGLMGEVGKGKLGEGGGRGRKRI